MKEIEFVLSIIGYFVAPILAYHLIHVLATTHMAVGGEPNHEWYFVLLAGIIGATPYIMNYCVCNAYDIEQNYPRLRVFDLPK